MSSPEANAPQVRPPHVEHRLVLSHDSHAIIHGTGPMGRFNTWLAVKITKTVGTMWIAYLFAAIALVSLPAAIQSGNVIIIIGWIAQTFFQLVLLPIIIVGQNVIQAANDARAEADHETLTAVHKLTIEVHAINEAQSAILRQLQATGA
ncbi:MAG: hypothetical protein ACREOY_10135 [Candidatus Dormibacteraceae bacterium]